MVPPHTQLSTDSSSFAAQGSLPISRRISLTYLPGNSGDVEVEKGSGVRTMTAATSGKSAQELAPWPVRARRALTPDAIQSSALVDSAHESDPVVTAHARQAVTIHDTARERTRLYARQLAEVARFLHEDPDVRDLNDDLDLIAMKLSTALRLSASQAVGRVRDAHRAVTVMPGTFAQLSTGDLPEDWHRALLRRLAPLTDAQAAAIDAVIATWEVESISRAQFDRHLGLAISLALSDVPEPPRPPERDVTVQVGPVTEGTATLSVTGPMLEILSLSHRLDAAARTVQAAQRQQLAENPGEPLPFDPDGTALGNGRALSLAALRYLVLTHSLLHHEPVEAPKTAFTLFVTVPAMTLLGASDAPGMLEGGTPIPAEQARYLAAGQPDWQRLLTDPVSGAYLDAAPTRYTPTAAQRAQLRLRHPVCAAPGCRRSTTLASEDDHIEEFDHQDPVRGGPTELANLHRLCWRHHQLKTAGHLDPTREPAADLDSSTTRPPATSAAAARPCPGAGSAPPGLQGRDPAVTRWTLDGAHSSWTVEHTDMTTPLLAATLERNWREHLAWKESAEARAATRPEGAGDAGGADGTRRAAGTGGADRPGQPPF